MAIENDNSRVIWIRNWIQGYARCFSRL